MEQQLIEYAPLNSLLLINGNYPMPVMFTKASFKEHHNKDKPLVPLKKKIRKFYHKRHFLFKLFDKGIVLDEESWYSVVPEDMAKYIALKLRTRCDQIKLQNPNIIDAFCGSGGLAIQLAHYFDDILCVDLDQTKIDNLSNNSKIYGKTLKTIKCDFLQLPYQPNQNTIITLCPPWGGINYLSQKHYDLEAMNPKLSSVLNKAISITSNILIQLPRNIQIKQLITLIQDAFDTQFLKRFSMEIEMFYLNNQLSQLFVYIGSIVKSNLQQEIECISKGVTHQTKDQIRNSLKQEGFTKYLKQVVVEDQIQFQI